MQPGACFKQAVQLLDAASELTQASRRTVRLCCAMASGPCMYAFLFCTGLVAGGGGGEGGGRGGRGGLFSLTSLK